MPAKRYNARRMQKWWVVSFFTMHFLVVARPVFAENISAGGQTPSPVILPAASSDASLAKGMIAASAPVDECKETLPQLEEKYSQVIIDLRSINQNVMDHRDGYTQSFEDLTQALIQFSQKKEEALGKIVEGRTALETAEQNFMQNKNQESLKALQESYFDLTVRIYSQAMESQSTVDTLKAQLAQMEAARGQYQESQKSQADLDSKKLELEGKIASLKIRCQK